MRAILLSLIMICLSCLSYGQAPDWYKAELKRQIGTWIADNSGYMSDQETDDAYGLEWKWGPDKRSLRGELFGMKDGKKTNTYWQFFNYWDKHSNSAKVLQVSPWGSSGKGTLILTADGESKLDQIFIHANCQITREGHSTKVYPDREVGSSYSINENNEWIKKRTYTWIKE